MIKTSWKTFGRTLFVAALISSAATPAKAWLDAPFSSNPVFIWHWQPIPLNLNNIGNQTTSTGGKKRKVRTKPRPVPAPLRVKTSFRPSMAVRKRNFAQFVAKTRAVNPQGADQLQKQLGSQDVMGALGRGLAPLGLKTNDVADAMTLYVITAWNGTRGRSEDPTRVRCLAVRRQMAAAIANTPQFATATDAQKQEYSEAMLIHAMLLDATVADAKSKPQEMDKLKAAIAQGAKVTLGLDLRRLQLTDAGLRML